MIEDQPSRWAQERFGAAAADLRRAVTSAIVGTHERAFRAHAGARASAKDTYGTTVWVEQFDELKTATEVIPGVQVRKVPELRRFSLPVVEQTAVVLYPWCYAKDPSQPRRTAKMKVSEARRSLLTLTERPWDGQLTLDHAALTAEQVDAVLVEEQTLRAQLAEMGRVVVIAYACNPAQGVFDLGWGDAELDLDTGEVTWSHWEQIRLPDGGQGLGGQGLDDTGAPLRPVSPQGPGSGAAATAAGPKGRFDDAPLDDDFDLRPQNPLDPATDTEPDRPRPATGSGGTDTETDSGTNGSDEETPER